MLFMLNWSIVVAANFKLEPKQISYVWNLQETNMKQQILCNYQSTDNNPWVQESTNRS